MKKTRFWVIFIAAIFIISCLSAVIVFLWTDNGNVVSIYHHGDLIDKIHLDTVTTPYSFRIGSENGDYNIVTVEHGRICVSEASCPDHVCINTGWISDTAIPIVCLPNELVIQVEASESEVDSSVQ